MTGAERPFAQGEIIGWFRPSVTPAGGAPAAIRERWVGIPLPLRRLRPAEGPEHYLGRDVIDRSVVRPIADGVAIEPRDAIAALRLFGEHEAADWWEDLLRHRPLIESLVFRRMEGELLPPRLAKMLHPELEDF